MRMTRSRRPFARVATFAILALVLSACIKLDMALTVKADDTVDGTIVFALNKQLIELTGQSAEDLLGDSGPIPTDIEGVSTDPYEDDEFQGQEITLEAVPLSRFNQQGEDPDSLKIVRQGDTFVVSGALDLSSAGTTGATGASGFPGAEQIFESAQMQLQITFPGEVLESNGQVDGNTVTWVPEVGERLELRATASAEDGGGGSILMILLIVGAVVVVVAIVVGILVARRKPPAETDGDAMASTAPMGGAAPPPPTGTPPPTSPPPPPSSSEPWP
jgi:hypothetical protein